MRMDDGAKEESTTISWALKWREEEKLNRLGTVNSDVRSTPGNKLPKTSYDPEGRDPETAK